MNTRLSFLQVYPNASHYTDSPKAIWMTGTKSRERVRKEGKAVVYLQVKGEGELTRVSGLFASIPVHHGLQPTSTCRKVSLSTTEITLSEA